MEKLKKVFTSSVTPEIFSSLKKSLFLIRAKTTNCISPQPEMNKTELPRKGTLRIEERAENRQRLYPKKNKNKKIFQFPLSAPSFDAVAN